MPCCHHDLNEAIRPDGPAEVLRPLLRHGILRERTADLVTDAFRALALRIMGYRTDVVEFVSTEHTAEPDDPRRSRTGVGEPAFVREYRAMKQFWGVTPYIEVALGESIQATDLIKRRKSRFLTQAQTDVQAAQIATPHTSSNTRPSGALCDLMHNLGLPRSVQHAD